MLHQDTKSLELIRSRKQVRLHLSWKPYIRMVECLNIQCDNRSEFRCDLKKLLEKHNADISRTTTKNKGICIAFMETFNKELPKELFKPMDI